MGAFVLQEEPVTLQVTKGKGRNLQTWTLEDVPPALRFRPGEEGSLRGEAAAGCLRQDAEEVEVQSGGAGAKQGPETPTGPGTPQGAQGGRGPCPLPSLGTGLWAASAGPQQRAAGIAGRVCGGRCGWRPRGSSLLAGAEVRRTQGPPSQAPAAAIQPGEGSCGARRGGGPRAQEPLNRLRPVRAPGRGQADPFRLQVGGRRCRGHVTAGCLLPLGLGRGSGNPPPPQAANLPPGCPLGPPRSPRHPVHRKPTFCAPPAKVRLAARAPHLPGLGGGSHSL